MSEKYLKCFVWCSVIFVISFFFLKEFYSHIYILLFLSKIGILVSVLGSIILFLLLKFTTQKRADQIMVNIFLFLATLSILLLIGEFTTRIILRNISTTPHMSYFTQRWGKKYVHLNKMGFRDHNFKLDKKGSAFRIAVVGDSFAFGQGIDEDERFSNLLEKKLNDASNVKFEVMNFGIPGAETIDEVKTLKKYVMKIHPDFVLLQWFINDFEGHDKSFRPKMIPLIPSFTIRKYLVDHSALYYLISTEWDKFQEDYLKSYHYSNYMVKRFGNPQSEDSERVAREITSFITICKTHNVSLGVVLFPELIEKMKDGYPFTFLHDRVDQICDKNNVPWLDLLPAYASFVRDYKKLWANRFDSHPGLLANRIAADLLMRKFGSVWLTRGKEKREDINLK